MSDSLSRCVPKRIPKKTSRRKHKSVSALPTPDTSESNLNTTPIFIAFVSGTYRYAQHTFVAPLFFYVSPTDLLGRRHARKTTTTTRVNGPYEHSYVLRNVIRVPPTRFSLSYAVSETFPASETFYGRFASNSTAQLYYVTFRRS